MTKTILTKTEARQGETRNMMRYVLVISTAAAVTALIVTFLLTL